MDRFEQLAHKVLMDCEALPNRRREVLAAALRAAYLHGSKELLTKLDQTGNYSQSGAEGFVSDFHGQRLAIAYLLGDSESETTLYDPGYLRRTLQRRVGT